MSLWYIAPDPDGMIQKNIYQYFSLKMQVLEVNLGLENGSFKSQVSTSDIDLQLCNETNIFQNLQPNFRHILLNGFLCLPNNYNTSIKGSLSASGSKLL